MGLKSSDTIKRIMQKRQTGILLVLLCMVVFMAVTSDVFLTWPNITSILQQTAIKGILAVGMTLVIIAGGIDLSVGSTVALSALISANTMVKYGSKAIWLAIIIALVVGAICGLINGFLISVFKVQPFLITMGTMNIYRGVQYTISNARVVRGLPGEFTSFMNSTNSKLPIPVIILLAVAVIIALFAKYTKYGRYIFAIGGNEEAARLSGVNVKMIRMLTYILVGVICGIGAIVYLGRLASVDANAGTGYELDAIAAAAIGGASLNGGKGNVIGTILGALILCVLANGLTLLNIQSFYQVIATGVIIIIAVLIDKISDK